MRTILERGDSGAYRVGSDGPKIASTGVPTAAARCIGPVSPVMNNDSRSSTAASTTRSISGGSSSERHIGGPRGAHGVEHGLVGGRADEHDRCTTRARDLGADLREPDGIPFLDAPAGRRLDADQRAPSVAVPTSSAALRRASSGMFSRTGRLATGVLRALRYRYRRLERARDKRLRILGNVRARIGRDRIGQHSAAAAREKSHAPRCARQGEQQVAPDVGLEIDREIVVSCCATPSRARRSARHDSPRPSPCHPRHVERFNGITPGMSAASGRFQLPTTRSICRLRRHRSDHRNRLEHHRPGRRPLQSKQKDAARRAAAGRARCSRGHPRNAAPRPASASPTSTRSCRYGI